jgi:hypothetical protein
MRKRIPSVLFLMLTFVVSESFAQDDTKFYTECAFSPGDSIDKVKQFYGVAAEPEITQNVQGGGHFYKYDLKQYGISMTLDDHMRVAGLRFAAPFRGRIGGIAIGDTADRVRSLRGEPTQQNRGAADLTPIKNRDQQIQVLLDALPDPVPKSEALKTFAEIKRIWNTPIKFNSQWVYDPGKRSVLYYEFGAEDNKVQTVAVHDCKSIPRL